MRSTLLTAFVSVVSLTSLAWAAPVAAQAASGSPSLACGQTVSSSVRLTHDLAGCPGNGLVIGADNITVDLAGHTISGVNAAGSVGITDDGHGGVRIRNGTITNFFADGVALRNAPHSRVSNLTVRTIGAGGAEPATSAGVLVDNSPNSSVTTSTVRNDVSAYQSDGVDVLSSADTTVRANRITNNAWDGMVVIDSPATRVIGNALDGNQNQGVEVNAGSDGTLLLANQARNNMSDGLVVGAISGARVAANRLTGNGDTGLFMFDLVNSRVSGNRAAGNAVGIDLEGGQHGSSGVRIADNDTSGNTQAGLVVGSGANDNVVVGNVSDANQGGPDNGGGIVLVGVTGNTVRNNVANHNNDVGIGVFEDQPGDSTGNVLTANTANFNQDHGIVAVAGTVDGGRNVARHNTPPPDCVGVSCT